MTSHEYEVRYYLYNCTIITLAHLPDENLGDHNDWAINQADEQLIADGIDISKLDFNDIEVIKTGVYR
jgi:hypothetical protein